MARTATDERPRARDGATRRPSTPERPSADAGDEQRQPSWWHRDHPMFVPLAGFFTGLAFVILVPACTSACSAWSSTTTGPRSSSRSCWSPSWCRSALVANQRTRRFGRYFFGMVPTAIVVVGVGALVLWFLVKHQS